jgi:hypothetical protein
MIIHYNKKVHERSRVGAEKIYSTPFYLFIYQRLPNNMHLFSVSPLGYHPLELLTKGKGVAKQRKKGGCIQVVKPFSGEYTTGGLAPAMSTLSTNNNPCTTDKK